MSKISKSITVKPLRKLAKKNAIIDCPGDKSVTHRAVIFAGLANGYSEIIRPLDSEDCLATVKAMEACGCKVRWTKRGKNRVIGVYSPGFSSWVEPKIPIDCQNSGTTARLLTGLFSGADGKFFSMWGDESLTGRPMMRVVSPLRILGAKVSGRNGGANLPLGIVGSKLTGGKVQSDKASAQVKSSIILAAIHASGRTTIRLPRGSRDHTEVMLRAMGVSVESQTDGDCEVIEVSGPVSLAPFQTEIPGDPSSAAFFAVMGALLPENCSVKVRGVMKNPTRSGFVNVLDRMGVPIKWLPASRLQNSFEPVGDLEIRGARGRLRAVKVAAAEIPSMVDEIPILAVAAAFADGVSHFEGLEELRVKESDRLGEIGRLLKLANRRSVINGDSLAVHGSNSAAKAFRYDPKGDHRLAMSASILAKYSKGPCSVFDPECVRVSFPGFFDELSKF